MSNSTLRIVIGFLMLTLHGWPKYQNYSAMANSFPDPLGVGSPVSLGLVIFAEMFCSILLISGTFVRLAAIPLMITMGIATFVIHINDPISKIELPFIYLVIYGVIFLNGSGRWALKLKNIPIKHPLGRWLLDI
jgi:putative oxidoreductase